MEHFSLSFVDIAIIIGYLVMSVLVGYWVSKRASRDMQSYFLGGNSMPWYILGISNASGMFDISGTMLLVTWMFVYGLKSVFVPWLWPTFNQIFLMVFLSAWLRRSNVMTGAEWIKTRFGNGRSAQLSHLIVVIYAFISIIGFFTYGFKGIGKFAAVFIPIQLSANPATNENLYALILIGITAIYVIKGGMISVVITEFVQFCILSVASFAVGIIAMSKISPETLHKVIPTGWDDIFFHWHLGLNWDAVNMHSVMDKINADRYGLFGFFVMMLMFKGVLISMAGPAPNYDMQRILSSKNPREASMMSGWVNLVLTPPRYFLIAGLTILCLVQYSGHIQSMGKDMDFEKILPLALANNVPHGLLGFLIAGLLAAFMSNFAATVNAAPPYFVNDIYKRFINPNASPKTYVRLSYVASLVVVIVGALLGWYVTSVGNVVAWIVTGLWGGYTASNVLKWYWWRFNGYGYFWGMVAGITSALTLPMAMSKITPLQAFADRHSLNLDVSLGFAVVFGLSLIGCFAGTLLTEQDDEEVLKSFYKRVRPWGFWGPILKKVQAEDPTFEPNKDFFRDMFNVVVGVIWQVSLVALPIYVVIRKWPSAAGAAVIVVVTSVILKLTWYDHMKELEHINKLSEEEAAKQATA
jgi:Na+/proline symporter